MVILAIWSWSLLQFTMVLTATKVRKDQSGLLPRTFNQYDDSCCTPDVYGIIISIFMQDAPFLVLRLLLIFYYGVVSYTNFFFTCKNTLVILLLLYRLVVIQIERRRPHDPSKDDDYMRLSESSSRMRLMVHSNSTDQYYNYRTKVNLREPPDNPDEPKVNYIIKRHLSIRPQEEEEEETREEMLPPEARCGDEDDDDDDGHEEREHQEEEAFIQHEFEDDDGVKLDLGDMRLDLCDNALQEPCSKASDSNHVNKAKDHVSTV